MNSARRIENRLGKPAMLFDGECRFCRTWVKRWQQATGESIQFVPLQDATVAENFPGLMREELESAVHFVTTDGAVYCGAEAVFRGLAVNPRKRTLLNLYERLPLFAWASEYAYRFIANHRSFFSRVTRWLLGPANG